MPPSFLSCSEEIHSQVVKIPCKYSPEDDCRQERYQKISSFTTGTKKDVTIEKFQGIQKIEYVYTKTCDPSTCCAEDSAGDFFTISWNPLPKEAGVLYNVYSKKDLKNPIIAHISSHKVSGFLVCYGNLPYPNREVQFTIPRASNGFLVRAVDLSGNEDSNATVLFAKKKCGIPFESSNSEVVFSSERRDEIPDLETKKDSLEKLEEKDSLENKEKNIACNILLFQESNIFICTFFIFLLLVRLRKIK